MRAKADVTPLNDVVAGVILFGLLSVLVSVGAAELRVVAVPVEGRVPAPVSLMFTVCAEDEGLTSVT